MTVIAKGATDAAGNSAAGYDALFRPGYVHRDLYVSPALFAQEMRQRPCHVGGD